MKNGLRTGKIEIDTLKPKDVQWVSATIQHLELDDKGNITSIKLNSDRLYRRVDKVATEMQTFVDPLTGESHTMSIAGIATGIAAFLNHWITEDNPGTSYCEGCGMVVKDAD